MLKKVVLSGLLLVVLSVAASTEQDRPPIPICFTEFTAPVYPFLARRQRVEDTVTVKFRTDVSGRILNDKIEEISSKYGDFNNAIEAVLPSFRMCSCEDAGLKATFTFQFRLEGKVSDIWAPTSIRFISPSTFVITTTPGPPVE
jgi:TonB family protein